MNETTIRLIVLGIVALLSGGSLAFTIWYNLRQAKVNAMNTYLAQLVSIESQIAKTPSVLRFHGLDARDLIDHDVSAEEFSYLVTTFTLGGVWYKAFESSEDIGPYKPGEYRYDICASPATQKAWPLLKRMMEDTPYRKKIDATINVTKQS